MQTDAPNINGTFPLAGERIGPAWREAWATLTPDAWAEGLSLAAAIAPRHGLTSKAVTELLRRAARAGLLESCQQRRPERNRASAHYRVRTS